MVVVLDRTRGLVETFRRADLVGGASVAQVHRRADGGTGTRTVTVLYVVCGCVAATSRGTLSIVSFQKKTGSTTQTPPSAGVVNGLSTGNTRLYLRMQIQPVGSIRVRPAARRETAKLWESSENTSGKNPSTADGAGLSTHAVILRHFSSLAFFHRVHRVQRRGQQGSREQKKR